MTQGNIFKSMPEAYRRKGWITAMYVPLRAALEFISLAALIPVLVIILDSGWQEQDTVLAGIYRSAGIADERKFVIWICMAVILVTVVKNVLSLMIMRAQNSYAMSLYRYFSHAVFTSYCKKGLLFIKGGHSSPLERDVNTVCYMFATGVVVPAITFAGEAVFMALILGVLAFYSLAGAIILPLCFVPAVWVYTKTVRKKLEKYGRMENTARRRQGKTVQEAFRGYAEAETSNAFPVINERFRENLNEISVLKERSDTVMRIPGAITESAVALCLVLIVIYGMQAGGAQVLFGVCAVAAMRILPSVKSMLGCWAQIKANSYTAEIIASACTAPEGPAEEKTPVHERLAFEKEITIENIVFSFPGRQPVVENFSAIIKKGERIGIKGVSGIGKTTLFNILLGLYPLQKGRISVDGVPVEGKNVRKWQNITGYVPQDVFIADATLAENVALGSRQVNTEKVREALERVRLLNWADSLPEGINTRAGEGGCRISGGQKQRIGIARALYRDVSVLFMDEATSALDTHTETEVVEAVNAAAQTGLTVLMIAHRESTLRTCDRIIELETQHAL